MTDRSPPAVRQSDIRGAHNRRFEAAMRAFHRGPPGIVRRVAQSDSTPPSYEPLTASTREERQAIADAINAYLSR